MYKYEIYGRRYYYNFIDGDAGKLFNFAPSTTTIASRLLPDDEFVKIKKHEMGLEEFSRWFSKKADFGTVFHLLIKSYFDNKSLLCSEVLAVMKSYHIDEQEHSRMIKGLLAIIAFVKEYELEPTYLEQSFMNPRGFAGTIDFYGYSNKLAKHVLIDWKSGSYASLPVGYELQLNLYKLALTDSGFVVDDCYMVSPKAWIKEPSCNVIKGTNKLNAIEELARYFCLFGQEDADMFHKPKYYINENFELTADNLDISKEKLTTTLAKELERKQSSASEIYGKNAFDI